MKDGVGSLGLLIKVEWCSVPSNKVLRDLVFSGKQFGGSTKAIRAKYCTKEAEWMYRRILAPSILLDRHLCDDAPCAMPRKSFAVLLAERLFCQLFQRFYVVFVRNGVHVDINEGGVFLSVLQVILTAFVGWVVVACRN